MAVAEILAAPAAPSPVVRPGFWERLIAFAIDYQAIALAVQIVTLPSTLGRTTSTIQRGAPASALPDVTGSLFGLVVFVLYFVYFWSGQGGGRTWGMRVMGLRVTREDGSALTLTRSLIRVGGLIVSCLVLFIGVIWSAFDAKKQGWHDKMAGSVVVRAEAAIYPPHPVAVTIAPPVAPNRFWAVPVIGILVKFIALIPVFIMVFFAATAAAFVVLVAWIPVLIVGRYPGWAFTFIRGLMRWSLRTNAFVYGLTDRYPWPGAGPEHPVALAIEPPTSSSRLWAIPLLGLIVKAVVLIPVVLLTSFAGQGLGFTFFIAWAPVLFTGTYPEWGYRVVQANLRWNARVEAFFVGVNDLYPDPWNWER